MQAEDERRNADPRCVSISHAGRTVSPPDTPGLEARGHDGWGIGAIAEWKPAKHLQTFADFASGWHREPQALGNQHNLFHQRSHGVHIVPSCSSISVSDQTKVWAEVIRAEDVGPLRAQ